MGIYTSNRIFNEAHDYASEIPANEAYDAAFGCAHILADCQANDMALFESSIYSDMQEVMAVHEGYQVVNENAFSNVIKKIVEMFKKLIAKIKGIFKAFLAKLDGAFKNGKELVKKYEKQIIKYSNWKDLKIKGVRKPKNESIKSAIDSLFNFELSFSYYLGSAGAGDSSDKYEDQAIFNGFKYNTVKKIKDAEAEDIKLAMLNSSYIKGVTISDYKDVDTEIKDYLYDDEDTLDGEDDIKSASFFSKSWIKTILEDEKWEKDVQKAADKMDKVINKIIDDLNKTDDNLAKFMVNKDNAGKRAVVGRDFGQNGPVDKDTEVRTRNNDVTEADKKYNDADKNKQFNENMQKGIHALQTLASNEQEVITKVTSLYMENIKFATAQARKLWTAAAAWSSGTHKESVEYYQALGEAAAEQFYTNMEAIGA